MRRQPSSIPQSQSIGAAVEALLRLNEPGLPVVGEDGRFLGTFSLHDLMALLVPRVALIGNLLPNMRFIEDDIGELGRTYRNMREQPVSRAVNRDAATVFPDMPAVEAIRHFCRGQMIVPVVEHGTRRLVGVISFSDVARSVIDPPHE